MLLLNLTYKDEEYFLETSLLFSLICGRDYGWPCILCGHRCLLVLKRDHVGCNLKSASYVKLGKELKWRIMLLFVWKNVGSFYPRKT